MRGGSGRRGCRGSVGVRGGDDIGVARCVGGERVEGGGISVMGCAWMVRQCVWGVGGWV